MAIHAKDRCLLAKVSPTYGVDPLPTGSANAVLFYDLSIQPMQGQDVELAHRGPWLGNAATLPADLHMVVSFAVDLVPSGTEGVAPSWGVLLRGCGVEATVTADTSVAYRSVSDGHESLCIHFHLGGVRYVLLGARGTCVIDMSASALPKLRFTFTGLWTKPTDTAKPTPDYSSWPKGQIVSKANTPVCTVNDIDLVCRRVQLDLGRQVEPHFKIGHDEIRLTEFSETLEVQIEHTSIATFDPFAAARDGTDVPVQIVHGASAGAIATLDVPKALIQRPDSPTEAQGIMELPLRMLPLPDTGNDQWTLTLT